MKMNVQSVFILGFLLLWAQLAQAEIEASGTFYFSEFKNQQAYCEKVVIKTIGDDLNVVAKDKHTIHANDRRYHKRFCIDLPSGHRHCTKPGYRTSEALEVKCYKSGEGRVILTQYTEDTCREGICSSDWLQDQANNFEEKIKYTLHDIKLDRERKAQAAAQRADPHYTLEVKTIPPHANIRIMDITPKYYPDIKIRPGQHRLRISKPGYITEDYFFEMPSYNTLHTITLEKDNKALVKAIEDGNVSAVAANITSKNVNRKIEFPSAGEPVVPLSMAVFVFFSADEINTDTFGVLMDITRMLLKNGAKPSLAQIRGNDLYTSLYVLIQGSKIKTEKDKLMKSQFPKYFELLKAYGARLNQAEVSKIKRRNDDYKTKVASSMVVLDIRNLQTSLDAAYVDNGRYPGSLSELSFFHLSKDVEVLAYYSSGKAYVVKLGHSKYRDIVYAASSKSSDIKKIGR